MKCVDPIRITDPADQRIAAYRNIRERDLSGREGLFIAEGKVVLNVLFAARRFAVESVLLLENRVAGMEETLRTAPEGTPVYVADHAVMDGIAGFHLHRGVLAVGQRRTGDRLPDLIEELPGRAVIVVLIGISNHDNVGAIFRNAAAFGADAVLLDRTSCDPLYRKAIRVSVGAALKVPFVRDGDADSILAALSGAGFEVLALSPDGGLDIVEFSPTGRTALVLGTEGEGLPAALLAKLRTARIGMAAGFDSLNVAAASAVALHHLWRRSQVG
ncbi:MAG: RNA methyltransferase [Rhizobiales bacterium 65-79]|jgi:tRNA G18 (ribose-2'-O)-methylase SpoU|nr:RNA methyltransferase [Hyphomicrobiales bacterium]OJU04064.1 MAG: RNA methyltransferase [Rhizobiales bacterium 65-79]